MSDNIIKIIIAILGIFLGSYFNFVGSKLSNRNKYKYSNCNECGFKNSPLYPMTLYYIFNLGKCKNCKKRISILPMLFEIICSISFVLCFESYKNIYPELVTLLFSFLFVSSLLILMISDIKFMIIPDQVLIFFGIVLVGLKLLIGYYNEEYKELMDVGYSLLFILYDGFFTFLVLYFVKAIGDFFSKKDTIGYGDLKMMFFISMFLGWKMALFIVFLAAFLSLPACSINMLKNSKATMIAFGPYLTISTLIIFLLKIDINSILNYIM